MTTWISADHHFGHENIIKYTNRIFKNVHEMDKELIGIWNTYIAPNDSVWYLGDFTLGNRRTAAYYFSFLNGNITVLGNIWHHDKRWLSDLDIPGATPYKTGDDHNVYITFPLTVIEKIDIDLDGNDIPAILCHYAFEVWDRAHYGSLHFHAHSHGMLPRVHNRLDVGIDSAYKLLGEYRPLRLEEACKLAREYNAD